MSEQIQLSKREAYKRLRTYKKYMHLALRYHFAYNKHHFRDYAKWRTEYWTEANRLYRELEQVMKSDV